MRDHSLVVVKKSYRRLEDGAPGSAAILAAIKHKGWYSRNYLPHLDAPHLFQSITFRLHDALPAEVVTKLEYNVRNKHITDAQKRRSIEAYMDAGHGACWLRRPEIAQVVQDALQYLDGKRYRLLAWSIMPNHVHALIETFAGYLLHQVVHSWKSFSATRVNALLQRRGHFWQRDFFDRYVRDVRHYEGVISYIENNPVKAGLVRRAEEWRYSKCLGASAFCRF